MTKFKSVSLRGRKAEAISSMVRLLRFARNDTVIFIVLCLFVFVRPSFSQEVPFKPGETIEYDVRKVAMRVGSIKLVYEGPTKYNGVDVLLIEFTATGPNFADEEKIYLDPTTFNPLFVDRDVKVFGGKEKIMEVYDPKAGKVTIKKTTKNKTDEQIIDKDSALENIYGFIYRYRLNGQFNQDQKISITLPTKDVIMKYEGTKTIEVMGKKQTTHFLQSDPPQFRIWFDSSSNKIPVRIDGAAGFGKTSMVLKNYQP